MDVLDTRLLRATLVLAALLLVAGCGAGDAEPSAKDRVAGWLDDACGVARTTTSFEGRDKDVADAGGSSAARGSCVLGDDAAIRIEAYVFEDDPRRNLVRVMDGWESGDGVEVTFAIAELDDGTWGTLFAFTDDADLFDDVTEADDDLDWDVVATHE